MVWYSIIISAHQNFCFIVTTFYCWTRCIISLKFIQQGAFCLVNVVSTTSSRHPMCQFCITSRHPLCQLCITSTHHMYHHASLQGNQFTSNASPQGIPCASMHHFKASHVPAASLQVIPCARYASLKASNLPALRHMK